MINNAIYNSPASEEQIHRLSDWEKNNIQAMWARYKDLPKDIVFEPRETDILSINCDAKVENRNDSIYLVSEKDNFSVELNNINFELNA